MAPKSFPLTEVVASTPEMGVNPLVKPTSPSQLWPHMLEARQRQCSCATEGSEKRMRAGLPPVLKRDCRVHNKVCQAADCEHGSHIGLMPHFRCEHCTNVLHICVVCEGVYLEDGDDPALVGWKFVENDPICKGWRCRRCR